MIEPICHTAYVGDLTRSGAAQYDLMLARAVYVHHEAEGHRDGSVAFPP